MAIVLVVVALVFGLLEEFVHHVQNGGRFWKLILARGSLVDAAPKWVALAVED